MNLKSYNVLVLNSVWMPIGITSYQKALVSLNSETNGQSTSKALDINYKQIGDNEWDFNQVDTIIPLSFLEWLSVPIRPFDSVVRTINRSIRLPSVIITQFSKMPVREIKMSNKSIMERDNYTCQYTGKKYPKSQLNIDHVIPKSRSGKDEWTNVVTSHKDINSKKDNQLNEEIGLKLIRKPVKPLPIPACSLIKEIRHRDWSNFLK